MSAAHMCYNLLEQARIAMELGLEGLHESNSESSCSDIRFDRDVSSGFLVRYFADSNIEAQNQS